MKKKIGIALLTLLALVLAVVLVFTGLYFTRFRTVRSIQKLTDYEDGYNLYRMDIHYNYSLE